MGTLASALIVNAQESRASKLWFRFGGSAPGVSVSHFALPPGSFPRSCCVNAIDVRDEVGEADREGVRAQLVAEWMRFEAGWVEGVKSIVAWRSSGRPVRISLGGVGGGRMLGMTPVPGPWPTRQAAVGNNRDARVPPFKFADARGAKVDRLAQRTKPP